ncbi:MAG: Trm112 family protein [Armatimonadetes bacterium]|nr:Trm112 family protein [Armatimonadota bacterium]
MDGQPRVDEFLESILACPACPHRPLLKKAEGGWECPDCGRNYPVIDGIPHLAVNDGLTPSPEQKQ